MAYRDPEVKRLAQAAYREANRDKLRADSRANRRKLKQEALDRYGRVCKVCGFDDIRALQIDHIADNGNVERHALGGQKNAGWGFYNWLKQNGWPDGYQTLCANHNMIKHLGENFS